ncbi:phosphatidylinositol N-acetylglucosaminyltransferase subunit H isoform X8 [Delphinapterus leucas]|uniref:Phosphatidylinositol N-acetylglucosaminyltransferase subunit H isoform X8 n=1 Tax=Delphinapterus leucas TaxID=9749 RepID=A0A2Y9MUC9_DELLE|nr:phosphatidylinositol N-acetylglucosaminyltransferase subunit H isoform X8 [Delphinapterus leucas]
MEDEQSFSDICGGRLALQRRFYSPSCLEFCLSCPRITLRSLTAVTCTVWLAAYGLFTLCEKVIYYLCILLKDPVEPHGISQVVPLFQSAKPRLDCLIEVYRSCQDILAHQKATSTSPEGGDKIISASNRRSHSGMGAYWHRQEDKSEQDHDPASRIGHSV